MKTVNTIFSLITSHSSSVGNGCHVFSYLLCSSWSTVLSSESASESTISVATLSAHSLSFISALSLSAISSPFRSGLILFLNRKSRCVSWSALPRHQLNTTVLQILTPSYLHLSAILKIENGLVASTESLP